MSISERIGNTLEQWSERWKDRLRGWFLRSLAEGAEKLMDDLEPPLREQVEATFRQIMEAPDTPPEYKAIIEKALATKSYGMLIMILVGLGSMIFGMVFSQTMPSLSGMAYFFQRKFEIYRLDPAAVITAWRRDPVAYEKLFDDLRDQGWNDDRIEALKFVTLFYPSPGELVHWQAREVFEPEMIARYGLDDEFEAIEKEPFYKAGMTDEQIRNFWRAHWEHASWIQVVEMLHRGQLTEAEVWDWFRVVEIPPFWRDKLIAISWNVPTRVDVRRWRDMGTISKDELREIYRRQGYHGVDLDNYVLWTEVYIRFPDLIARWKNGWITEDDVRNELIGLGMLADRVEEMIQTKIKTAKPERVTKERDLTKTDIYRGVKKEVITWSQGSELLQDMGYDEDEAEYILRINVGVLEGSPETYAEFKQWTQLYRKAQGLEAKLLPPELLEASRAVATAKEELSKAEEKGLKEAKLAPFLKAMSDAEYRYRQLLVKWEAETK